MKTYWGSIGIAPRILNLGIRWRWVVISLPGRFTLRERAPGIHWIGGWVSPRAGLDAVVKRKMSSPCWDLNPWSSGPQPSAIPLSYPGSKDLTRGWRKLHNEELHSRDLLGYDTVQSCGRIPEFRTAIQPPTSGHRWRQYGAPKIYILPYHYMVP
jgi:hypothetical protein